MAVAFWRRGRLLIKGLVGSIGGGIRAGIRGTGGISSSSSDPKAPLRKLGVEALPR